MTKKRVNIKNSEKGFTILELAIATSVFAVMLLIITTSILAIGRSYIKGYVSSQTQDIARSIVDNLSQSVQESGPNSIQFPTSTELTTGVPSGPNKNTTLLYNPVTGGYYWFCVGGLRYTVQYNNVVDANPANAWAFIQDNADPAYNCDVPYPIDQPSGDVVNELLNKNMQVLFDPSFGPAATPGLVLQPSSHGVSLYEINLEIMYGNSGTYNTNSPPYSCNPDSQTDGFCSTANVDTFAQQRTGSL